MAAFCYTVALTADTKPETLVFRLRAVQKKTLRYVTLREVFLQHFFHTPALYSTEWSRLRAILHSTKSRLHAM
jgi:hypothetical protein